MDSRTLIGILSVLAACATINLVLLCVVLCGIWRAKYQASGKSIGMDNEVYVTPERQMVINLLGSSVSPGGDTTFGSRRMGVVTTVGRAAHGSESDELVSWTPQLNSGFSIRVQVVARVASTNKDTILLRDVACFTFDCLGSRSVDGVTHIMSGAYDQMEQHSSAEPVNLPVPEVTVDSGTNAVSVRVRGLNGYTVNWGADIKMLESTIKTQPEANT